VSYNTTSSKCVLKTKVCVSIKNAVAYYNAGVVHSCKVEGLAQDVSIAVIMFFVCRLIANRRYLSSECMYVSRIFINKQTNAS
jgi:hypothetical protein